jgi:hypothetical protein
MLTRTNFHGETLRFRNAAVAGALLGAKLGYSQLPRDWLKGLPHFNWLKQLAFKLLDLLQITE